MPSVLPELHVRSRGSIGRCITRLAIAVAAGLAVAAAPRPAAAQQVESVLRWNQVLTTALAVPGANPATVFATRPLAMVSVAVFDAANAFQRRYHPYAANLAPAAGASPDAAVAQAAHDVLTALLPSQRATFDAALVASLAGLPETAARDGAALGAAVARAVLEHRRGDGWARPFPPLDLPSLPGYWRPTPPAQAPATFTNYPDVVGFIVERGRHFLMEAPPPLPSERYARDFNDTKTLGRVDSSVRTAEQTQVARLWASVGTSTTFFQVWPQVVVEVVRARRFSGLEAARTFALVDMTFHDALLTSFTGKFLYGFWRPVTAIRAAETDGNDATVADQEWTPLLPTPPYPGHPGNMACIGAAHARLLERLVGRDDVPFEVTWTGTTAPTVTRRYNGFRQLADEQARSRVWGGIHFEFENLASKGVCTMLAEYAADNVLRAR